jgi:isopentenyldiphosphate isomerase
MPELLEVYDLKGKFIKTQDRKEYYTAIRKEFESKGAITSKIKLIRLFLMTSQGRIYLQKRSAIKQENAGLYDKTVGGHVSYQNTWDMTVVKECAEELGFPASILSPKEFDNAIQTTDLSVVALFKKVDSISNFNSVRIRANGRVFVQPYNCSFYIGYYDGPIQFKDGESSGVEVFSLNELESDVKQNPGRYTSDLSFMVKKYKKFLKPIKKK